MRRHQQGQYANLLIDALRRIFVEQRSFTTITSTNTGYSALYDAAGQLTCRAPTSSQTCSPTTQTGQSLSYDALNRLTAWQNQPTSPTSTDKCAYDGSDERVWQQSVTTTTSYFGGLEEVTRSTTTHYFAAGPVTLELKGSAVSYLVNDGLGSVILNLSSTCTVRLFSIR